MGREPVRIQSCVQDPLSSLLTPPHPSGVGWVGVGECGVSWRPFPQKALPFQVSLRYSSWILRLPLDFSHCCWGLESTDPVLPDKSSGLFCWCTICWRDEWKNRGWSLFCRWGHWGWERLRDSSKVALYVGESELCTSPEPPAPLVDLGETRIFPIFWGLHHEAPRS